MNPFSNFHPCKFSHDGRAYNCSEQFIQYTKAKYFKVNSVADNILLALTGLECKQLAREIQDYNHERWKLAAKEECEGGITSKLMQTLPLQNLLKETGDTIIVECCHDTLWGTGVPIQDEKCLDEGLWYNSGIMGEILENIRGKLLREPTATTELQCLVNNGGMTTCPLSSTTNEETSMEGVST